jgi:hypothetical protein
MNKGKQKLLAESYKQCALFAARYALFATD